MNKKMRTFARYIVSGIITTGVHAGVFFVLRDAAWSVTHANLTAFLIANLWSYLVATFFVFETRAPHLRGYLGFLLVTGGGAMLVILLSQLSLALAMPDWSALLIVLIFVPIFNFILLNRFVFNILR